MKEMCQKNLRKLIHILLAAALVFTLLPPQSAQALSKKAQAFKAYSKMLSKSTVTVIPKGKRVPYWWDGSKYGGTKASNVRFAVAYIDSDSIPELILRDKNEYFYGIWTYRNGKVTCVYSNTFGTAAGYYKKKGVFKDYGFTEGTVHDTYWNKISSGKGKRVLTLEEFDDGDAVSRTYLVGKKAVSKSAFNKKLKSYVSSVKMSTYTMRSNTKANRNKYLK